MKQFSLLVGLGLCLALVSCSKPAEPEVAPATKVESKTNYILNVRHDIDKTKLKLGETIRVFGKIFDSKGEVIPHAKLNLSSIKKELMTRADRKILVACITTSDSVGNYEMSSVPIGFEKLYINFSHPGYPDIDFTNNLFNSCNGDVELDLYLPELLEIQGQVKTEFGKPVSAAQVWAEKHDCEHMDSYLRQTQFKSSKGLDGASTLTDSNGFFNLKINTNESYYAIKATTKMCQPAIAGIFTPENPPPDFIELILKTQGSSLVGRITNQAGLPVTNVQAFIRVHKVINDITRARNTSFGLEIDADGNYISQIMEPGTSEINFSSPIYKSSEKRVTIRPNETTFLDVVLARIDKKNGVVLDAFTKEPIAGVVLSNCYLNNQLKMSSMTDIDGKFWFEMKDSILTLSKDSSLIFFYHPSYAPVKKFFRPWRMRKNKSYIIYLSQASAVRVNLSGIPVGQEKNYKVRLSSDNCDGSLYELESHSIVNGTTSYTNLPTHFSPVKAILYGNIEGEMSVSQTVELVAGETVDINMIIPAVGKLVVDLAHPFNKKTDRFFGLNREFSISADSGCRVESKTLTWNSVPTNKYEIDFYIKDKNIFSTNIVVKANETTKIFVDFETNKCGQIFGLAKFEDSTPFECLVTAYAENSKKPKYGSSNNGEFIINDLDPDLSYTLKVRLLRGCIGSTNLVFKNIRPSSEAIELSLGHAYKIYGNVMDADGKPITNVTLNKFKLEPGFFEVYPVLEGKHIIKFNAKGYEPIEKEIIVYGQDQDLGDIYLLK